MLEEYNKLREEVLTNSKDPKWINANRPRLTLIDRKTNLNKIDNNNSKL